MSTKRILTLVAILGFACVGIIFFGPVILGILGEILCGGVILLATPMSILGGLGISGEYVVIGVLALIAVPLVLWSIRYAARRSRDTGSLGTRENTFVQNAAYIRNARAEGMTEAQIRLVFVRGGWKSEDIDKTFTLAQSI